MTKIYGHRGSKGTRPENTLLSFKKALEVGADGLELDIHLTLDGEIVVIHDETLDRTTRGKGHVKDLTLVEIKAMDESVPTLKEVLELMGDSNAELNIELKTSLFTYEGIEEKVVEVMKGESRRVIYSSFNLPSVLRLKALAPDAEIALILSFPIPQADDFMKHLGLDSLHLAKHLVLKYPNAWEGLHEKIRVWTVNEKEDVQKLLDLGVAAIITDYPKKAVKWAEKAKSR